MLDFLCITISLSSLTSPKQYIGSIPNSDVIAREEFDVCNEDEKGIDGRHGDKEECLD